MSISLNQSNNASPKRPVVTPELAARLANGQITLAQFAGISREKLYEMAKVAYTLLNSGKLEEARDIYRGLVAADPFDSVFHCHLAATYLRMGESENALKEFSAALRFNVANVDAFAGRGETYLNLGQLPEALSDLKRALELDPKSTRASTIRARGILLSLKDAVNKYKSEEKQSAASNAL